MLKGLSWSFPTRFVKRSSCFVSFLRKLAWIANQPFGRSVLADVPGKATVGQTRWSLAYLA